MQINERLNIDVVLKCETPLIRAIASRNTQEGSIASEYEILIALWAINDRFIRWLQ